MNFGWCHCSFSGSQVAVMDEKVIVADKSMGRMFLFTLDGHHTGGLGEADKCTKDLSFQPIDVAFADNQVFATDKATKALKRFNKLGELTETITSKVLGQDGKQPYSFAAGNDYYYIGFEGGPLVAYEKDFTEVARLDIFAVSMSCGKDALWIVAKDGKVLKAEHDLKDPEPFGSKGAYLGQLDGPVFVREDEAGNLWVAESGNKRVQVFWSDGRVSVWGVTTTDWGSPNIGEDPIEGRFPSSPITCVDVSDEYFYVVEGSLDPKAFAVPKSMLGSKWIDTSCHVLEIRLTSKSYNQYAKNLWSLQQALYPKVAICVFLAEEDAIYLDGKAVASGRSALGFLAEPDTLRAEIAPCLEGGPAPLPIATQGNKLSVDLTSVPDALDCRLVLVEVSGSLNPLVGNDVKVFVPGLAKRLEVQFEKPARPNVLYAIIMDRQGQCLGFAVIR